MSLRNFQYNLAIILPNSFSAAWLAFWAGCQTRVGYSSDHRGWLLNIKLPWTNGTRHLARPQIYLNLARAAGADVDLCQERIFTLKISAEESARADKLLGPKTSGPRIGLAPGSVALSRRWPAERYAQLADRLIKQGYQVVLIGSDEDRRVALAVARKARNKLLVLAGETNLREGLAIIRRLDLLVSNDSGAMHLAYAQGTKVLVLQGAADPRVTGPFGNCGFILRDENLKCSPCMRNECPRKDLKCMRNISVAQVWQKIQAILSGPDKSG
jgi:heptosyltransferase-2